MLPRVVADSNVLISAFAAGGNPRAVLLLASGRHIELFLSEAILEEVFRALTGSKFRWSAGRTFAAFSGLTAHLIDPGPKRLSVIADYADNRILECAVKAKAHYLVTGDRDLLDLGRYFRTRIVTPRTFLELL